MTNKILYCVLNWGLGHASRSIPIIEKLTQEGNEVHLASDGLALEMLKKAFPHKIFYELPGYDITYKYESVAANILGQCFKIIRAIKRENKAVKELVDQNGFQRIISDCRYGTYHSDCYNIFISHQIRLIHPNRFMQAAATKMNIGLIQKFNECWIPDNGQNQFSGKMSTSTHLEIPTKNIGIQSRFKKITQPTESKYLSISILSGPEPQRTLLEELLKTELQEIGGRHLIVSGKPEADGQVGNIDIKGLKNVEELTELIRQSKHIISRSGYSSIMDYEAMGRKAILIPTPGQTEQEYLGQLHGGRGRHIVLDQQNLELKYLLK